MSITQTPQRRDQPTSSHDREPPGRLWPSPWPAEDGGPSRQQNPAGLEGLAIAAGERLQLAARRDALATTMVVLRAPGEVYALRHSLGTRPLRDETVSWVERIDPHTLEPLARSKALAGGPFWPGGMAAHANGSLYVVHGRYCHRLSADDLRLLAWRQLPRSRPYNSFVVLADGTLAMKDLDLDLREPAGLMVLDPDTLRPRCDEVVVPEPVIARLAADSDRLYAVGATTVWRYRWDGARLELDDDWRLRYLDDADHSYGWDPVIGGGHLWFLDNGAHHYSTTMQGAGRSAGPLRLVRVSLADPSDHEAVEVCGLARGAATNPPLYDPTRRIAIAYDSSNGVVTAFRFRDRLEPIWQRELAHAGHMIQFRDTGELVLHDFHGPGLLRTGLAREIGRRWSHPVHSASVRRALAKKSGDDVVIVDIETGDERARARVPSMFQSAVFPAPGFDRDLYWCTLSTLARLEVA